MANCKKCGKPIKFIKNSNDKWILINPDIIYWREPDSSLGELAEDTIVFDNGETTKGVVDMRTGHYEGYQCHFDTCKGGRDI